MRCSVSVKHSSGDYGPKKIGNDIPCDTLLGTMDSSLWMTYRSSEDPKSMFLMSTIHYSSTHLHIEFHSVDGTSCGRRTYPKGTTIVFTQD